MSLHGASRAMLSAMAAIAALGTGERTLLLTQGHETTGPYKPGPGHRGILGSVHRGSRYEHINRHKRTMPPKRKHRVRIRAHVEGRLHGRPLTTFERRWLR